MMGKGNYSRELRGLKGKAALPRLRGKLKGDGNENDGC